nr:hypothetical protein [Planococcus glaciei]
MKKEWGNIGLELKENKFGFVYEKKIRYPLTHQHGKVELGELNRVLAAWEQVPFEHPFKLKPGTPIVFFRHGDDRPERYGRVYLP